MPEERIELSSPAYEVGILPLNYTGEGSRWPRTGQVGITLKE